ncbi:hypothetical protein ES703_40381 [subsurface metagenome]
MDVAPENNYWHDKPDVQDISIGGKDKYEQKYSYQKVRKAGGADIKIGPACKHSKAGKDR